MFFSGHVKSLVDYVGLPEPPAGKRPLHFKKDVTIKILNNSDQQWWKVRKHFINSHYCIYVVGVGFFSNKETTDTASSASFLDLYLEFDDSGQLCTQIYDITG